MSNVPPRRRVAAALLLPLLVVACDGGPPSPEAPLPSAGQVAPKPAVEVSYYAASRFAEQASFGPTPALVQEIRARGIEGWIDDQLTLPASQADMASFQGYVDPPPDEEWRRYRSVFPNLAIAARDQLRLRVTWALSQFIVISDRKGDLVGALEWMNLLQRQGLNRYDELLYQISINPMMGQYLDNNQNRPRSSECRSCVPNENFARELLQLFSLGVFKLNPDGTPERDARGRLQETYSQRDVEELARALTGWRMDPNPASRPNRNWANWAKPMVPTVWPPERDGGAKTVLGTDFPAGQGQEKELRDVVAMLMKHPNIAPFVATRMIQHLVKSNPTPAYVGRVAAVFRDNGQGVAGDMKALVKAVLLDAEARAGDSPASQRRDDGKFREPFLQSTAMWRAMGCRSFPGNSWNGDAAVPSTQRPFNAESVFSFYAPTDRAPGSNLLAPEQRLLTAVQIRDRLTQGEWPTSWQASSGRTYGPITAAGCGLDELRTAFVDSPRAFNDLLSARYFRGAMPPTLRSNVEQLMRETNPPWNRSDPQEGALRVLGLALTTPYFGVIK